MVFLVCVKHMYMFECFDSCLLVQRRTKNGEVVDIQTPYIHAFFGRRKKLCE